jgi:N utilization substance protein B
VQAGRRSARRQAVVILYQQDLLGLSAPDAIGRVQDAEISEYARRLVLGAAAERKTIESAVGAHLAGWSWERLGVLERSILRVAAYELIWEPEVPVAVIIDQAVELAKRFCSAEAGALVNGILGALASVRDVSGDGAVPKEDQ